MFLLFVSVWIFFTQYDLIRVTRGVSVNEEPNTAQDDTKPSNEVNPTEP